MNYLIVKVPYTLRYLYVWYLRGVRYLGNSGQNRFRLRLQTDIFKTTKSDPTEITITKGLLCFDLWFVQPK